MATTTKLEPFGVEVDADLKDPSLGRLIQDLFSENELLLFRDQTITLDDQKRVMSQLGPVSDIPSTVGYVSNAVPGGILGNAEVSFHVDYGYTPNPGWVNSLYAIDVEPGATSTRYAGAARALTLLPHGLRARIDGMQVLNIFALSESAVAGRQSLEGYPDDAPRAVHPLVFTDPVSGRRALYAAETYAAKIIGLDLDESEALLHELQAVIYAPDNVFEHFWHNGDVVIWSNILLHHARSAPKRDVPRTLQRVCVTDAPAEMYAAISNFVPADRNASMT